MVEKNRSEALSSSQEKNHETPIAFTRGVPPTEAFPTEQLEECLQAALAGDATTIHQYSKTTGYGPLRNLLAEEYATTASEVIITNGSLVLQDLLAELLIPVGGTVLVEQPSYDRAINIFRRRGARVVGVPLEADGVSLDHLETAVRQLRPAFFYTVPDFQNPTGITTSLAKRQAIIEIAQKYGFWIIEDSPYRRLRYQGEELPSLYQLGKQQVILLSSFSKILSPGFRVGYAIAPQTITESLIKLSEDTYLSPVLLTQAAVFVYLQRNWLTPNIEHLKQLYRPRWQAMLQATSTHLPGAQVIRSEGGFFTSVTLSPEANVAHLVERALERGLSLTPGSAFFADPIDQQTLSETHFLRLPFCAITPEQIDEGVRRLAALL